MTTQTNNEVFESDIIGLRIVGYRYGFAPISGYSYNSRDNAPECGVSMASVGYQPEVGSFAVWGAASRKKYYYEGVICGFGGDDEVCLSDVEPITYREYLSMRKNMVKESNDVVNFYADRALRLIHRGYNLGRDEVYYNNWRKSNLK